MRCVFDIERKSFGGINTLANAASPIIRPDVARMPRKPQVALQWQSGFPEEPVLIQHA
jgi:hypothetical protein